MATSKRTIYYYFGGKEDLYLAVLEEAYRRMRSIETGLDIEHLAPDMATPAAFAARRGNVIEMIVRYVRV